MENQQQCYLDHIMLVRRPWRLDEIVAVEGHVLSGTCQNRSHHSFKDLIKQDGDLGYTTPLLDACKKGHFEGVKRIIEVWRVDVDATATLFLLSSYAKKIGLDTDGLHGVTPLFVAALRNDVELVRYLVGKGANVSARTSTDNKGPFAGITSLHAALLHLTYGSKSLEAESLNQTDVIRILLESGADPSALSSDGTPAWMFGWFCYYRSNLDFSNIGLSNLSAITLLLEYGMRIDQRCPRLGRTLLHNMAGPANKFDEDDIVKLLIKKGADFQVPDKEGITPIMSAAIGNNKYPNMLILKFFMDQDDISIMDKIEALEVAVAVLLLGNPLRNTDIQYCLSRAQELRYIESITLIPKTPSDERAVEWATSSKLEIIQQRLSQLGMQSILIRLRIFSAFGWGAIYRYLWPYIKHKCTFYPRSRFDDNDDVVQHAENTHRGLAELLDISWTMLETIRRFAPTSDVEEISLVTDTVVDTLSDTLSGLKKKNDPLFNSETLETSFQLLATTLQAQSNSENDHSPSRTIKSLSKMFSFLVDLPDVMIQPISDYLKEIVSLNNEDLNQEKLIISTCKEETDNSRKISRGPNRGYIFLMNPTVPRKVDSETTLPLIRLLLNLGADADAVDGDGNGSLHLLAAVPNGMYTSAIAQLLLEAGAHLDRTNKIRLTAADVWNQKMRQERKRRREEGHPAGGRQELPDWLREGLPRLMCLSARIFRSHRLPYKKVLPPLLQSFVSFH